MRDRERLDVPGSDEHAASRGSPEEVLVDLSIVTPAFNEEANLEALCVEIEAAVAPLGLSWEVLIVDDGSRDASWAVVERLHAREPRIKGLRLPRNFGHQVALVAGLGHARGRAVVSLDADLQHPPEVIRAMVAAWQAGSLVVSTVREDAAETSWGKRVTSRLFYRLFSRLSGVHLEPGMADFRLLDRLVVDDVLTFREEGPFLRAIVEWLGYPSTRIPFRCRARTAGTSAYTPGRMLRLAWDGVKSFSLVPLRAGVILGVIASLVSLGGVAYAILGKILDGHVVPGWASTIGIISFLFALLFVFLGILGEYLAAIARQVRYRPRFVVRERLGAVGRWPASEVPRTIRAARERP